MLNFDETLRMNIYKFVSGCLHIGNTKYAPKGEDKIEITNPETVEVGAKMWGVQVDELKKYLCNRNVGSKEVIVVALNMVQAIDTRDALTKKVYGDLFQYTVDYINVVLSNGNAPRHKFIGVLDIFGFESFEVGMSTSQTTCSYNYLLYFYGYC